LNIAALELLEDAAPAWIELDRLAATLGSTAGELRNDLFRLEEFGFDIERHPHYGLRYAGPALRLCPDLMEWRLNTRLIGRRIAVWNRVTSTNDLALRAAASATNDGLAVFAEKQTRGRGRRGRVWHAPAGTSLLMSVLLFPRPALRDALLLTCLSVVAVCDTLEDAFALKPQIKWPNDVLLGGRKVCGILVELNAGAVLGIGLNCNGLSEDLPPEVREAATTLAEQTGTVVDRSRLARRLLQTLDAVYEELRAAGPARLWNRWRERARGRTDVGSGPTVTTGGESSVVIAGRFDSPRP
jgi:BirA family biotin operon repressor/biotin-[acetyl-CoA-carboxylase] ligase